MSRAAVGGMLVVELTVGAMWDGQPAPPEEHVHVRLSRDVSGGLLFEFDAPFADDLAPTEDPGPLWGLWNYEVVELFIAGMGEPEPYLEVEVGPYGHHLVIELSGPRNVVRSCLPIEVDVTRGEGRWRAVGVIPRDYLPLAPHRVNAYAIRGRGHERRYYAWQPGPGAGPDFHQLHTFAPLNLP